MTTTHTLSNGVKVEMYDEIDGSRWRLFVKTWSDWSSHYPGILEHEGVALLSPYWTNGEWRVVSIKTIGSF